MKTKTDFAKHLSSFLSEYLPHERNMKTNTIATYRDAFILFIKFMEEVKKVKVERLTLCEFNKDNVKAYLRWLLDEKHISMQTRNNRLAAVSSFSCYLQYRSIDRLDQWQEIRSIPTLKAESKMLNHLSVDGIKILLEQPNQDTPKGRRAVALLSLMYDTGARVSEIVNLCLGDLRIESEPYTLRVTGKGGKTRIIPLFKKQVELLKAYIAENGYSMQTVTSPLFQNARGAKLTRKGISYILKNYVDMLKVLRPDLVPGNISPHYLRHSRARHLLQEGVHIMHIKDLLGHKSVQTTEIYAREDSKAKREAIEKAYLGTTPSPQDRSIWERDKDLMAWLKGLGKK